MEIQKFQCGNIECGRGKKPKYGTILPHFPACVFAQVCMVYVYSQKASKLDRKGVHLMADLQDARQ